MIERYSRPEMARFFTDEARMERWLQVELAACEVMAERGEIPRKALRNIRSKAAFSVERVREIEASTRHDVIAFIENLAENIGPDSRYVHLGLTSSDVLDTAQALQLRDACDQLEEVWQGLQEAVKRRAHEHRRTPMVGRTHGIHAEPTTFGLKMASWYAELARGRRRLLGAREEIAVGAVSGAVGTFAHQPPVVEREICRRLGLRPEPVSTQVVPRDRHARLMSVLALMAASLERMAVEIRNLQRTDIREAEEPFRKGQKGSSAMPHKRNPIGCENVSGLARVVRGNLVPALENVALWHERDISHSSVERVILPDSFILVDFMTARMTRIVSGLLVYPERMRENLERTRGLIYSQSLLLALARAGVRREEAYVWVQRNAMRVWQGEGSMKELCLADADITGRLGEKGVRACFDLRRLLKHVDRPFRRAFRD